MLLPTYANSHSNIAARKQAPCIKINLVVPPSLLAHSAAELQVQICQTKCFTYFLSLLILCYTGNGYVANIRKTATSLSGLSICLSVA